VQSRRGANNIISTIGYTADRTGLLRVDPYNGFLSEGGKLWSMVKAIVVEENLLKHLSSVVAAARAAKIQIFIVSHHRWEPGDIEDLDHPSPCQLRPTVRQTFAKGSRGGEWHPDFAPQLNGPNFAHAIVTTDELPAGLGAGWIKT
jgi:nicotinamidase-related amidase